MKRFRFAFKHVRVVDFCVGRGMRDIPSRYPRLFAEADRIGFVMESAAPERLKGRVRTLFPARKAAAHLFQLPRSERAKTLEQAGRLCASLYRKGFSRRSLLIAAGGGAVTDLAGFAASLFMRGIQWVSVPTTFLAQIDAGLGGKTAVNGCGAKNVIGAFHQPALAVCDTAFLDSLPSAELRSGAGELVKYAMIGPAALRRTVRTRLAGALAADPSALAACVRVCAVYKLGLVAEDERDETGVRERLNLGHTAGHAFEALSGGGMPHGEAVARGLRCALILSALTGRLSAPAFKELDGLVCALGLPPPAGLRRDFKGFLERVSRDKKARGASNRFILLRAPGRLEAVEGLGPALLKKAFEGALA